MRANGRGCLSRHASRAGQGAPLRFELGRRHIAGMPSIVGIPNVRASPNRGHPCCLSTETKQVGFNYKG